MDERRPDGPTDPAPRRSLDEELTSAAYLHDPYATHRRLREEDPVHWCAPWGAWVVSRYEDVAAVLREDGRAWSAVGQTSAALGGLDPRERSRVEPLERLFSSGLLWSDPPDHTRIRSVVNKAMGPRDLARMVPRVEAIVESALDALGGPDPHGREVDLMEGFASVVPVEALAALLGIERADVGRFRAWADTLAAFIGSPRPGALLAEAAQDCVLEARAYIEGLIAARTRAPRDDVVSRLCAARAAGATMSDDELHATVIVLLVGGHRTTAALIASAVDVLCRFPDQRRLLAARPELLSSAVEELLRFESPHQRTVRIAMADTAIRGQAIRAGEVVMLLNGSADRDEAHFATPDVLDLARSPNRHLSFSAGIHFCIGAPLARAEAAAAIGGLLRRYPDLEPLEDARSWLPNHTLRTLTRLPVRLA